MKKLILIIATVLFFSESFGQPTNPAHSLSKQDYLTKSKKQKTGAWGLLGFGAAMLVGGTIIAASETGDRWNEGGDEGLEAAGVVAALGIAAMAGSIPLFAASGKNKRKAASLSFNNMRIPLLKNSSLVYRSMPALSLNINL